MDLWVFVDESPVIPDEEKSALEEVDSLFGKGLDFITAYFEEKKGSLKDDSVPEGKDGPGIASDIESSGAVEDPYRLLQGMPSTNLQDPRWPNSLTASFGLLPNVADGSARYQETEGRL